MKHFANACTNRIINTATVNIRIIRIVIYIHILRISDISYLKIYVSVLVHVECSEYMVTKFDGVTRWEKHLIHVDEFSRGQPSVRTILLRMHNVQNIKAPFEFKIIELAVMSRSFTLNPLYHSLIVVSSYDVCVLRKSMSSFVSLSLLTKQPMLITRTK